MVRSIAPIVRAGANANQRSDKSPPSPTPGPPTTKLCTVGTRCSTTRSVGLAKR
jgi:hypothetical protein